MASLKETPRQKALSILYLILLGLVAINVSTAVLDAFRNLTISLTTSTRNVQGNIDNTYKAFEESKLKSEPQRAQPIYAKAKQVSKYVDDLNTYVEDLKKLMYEKGGGINTSTGDVKKRNNTSISYRLMINQARAAELKKRINVTRDEIYAAMNVQDRTGLNFPLNTDDQPSRGGIKKTWEQTNFGTGLPLTAAITSLTKIQADLKNTESDVIKKILGQMDKAVVNLDQFSAVAVAPSSYLIQGQPYTAEIFLTASDSKSNPDISVNGHPLAVKGGKGIYTVNTTGEGIFSWKGLIKVKQTDGTEKTYETQEQKYQVARPSAVVSPDKMNVFYIGVSNPVSVSAPGIPKDRLRVSMSGGSISGGSGQYTVHVSSPGTARVVVSAEVSPGKVQTISSSEFRVKRIPDPRVKFGGKSGGRIATVALRSQNRIFATLDNFDFDAKFTIDRFTLIIVKPRADAIVLSGSGNSLSGSMQSAMGNITPGTHVIFDNIIATGPDGMKRQLDAVTLTAE